MFLNVGSWKIRKVGENKFGEKTWILRSKDTWNELIHTVLHLVEKYSYNFRYEFVSTLEWSSASARGRIQN